MFVLGLLLYASSSLLGGLASSPAMLVAARAVQGIGGAVLFPATLSLVNTTFAEAGAGASGLILGSADGPRVVRRGFDLPGSLTATLGSTLVVFALVQGPEWGWTSGRIVVVAALGVLLLAGFVVIESRSADPLMRLRLLANGNLRAGMLVTFLFMATFGTLLYFETVYLQVVHGYSALRTGLAFLVPMAAILIGSQTGTVLVALSLSAQGSYLALVPGLIVLGLGQGTTFVTMFAAAGTGVAAHEQGIASGMVSTGQQVGSAVGLAVLIAIAGAHGSGSVEGLRVAMLVAAVGIGLTLLVALTFRRRGSAPVVDRQLALV